MIFHWGSGVHSSEPPCGLRSLHFSFCAHHLYCGHYPWETVHLLLTLVCSCSTLGSTWWCHAWENLVTWGFRVGSVDFPKTHPHLCDVHLTGWQKLPWGSLCPDCMICGHPLKPQVNCCLAWQQAMAHHYLECHQCGLQCNPLLPLSHKLYSDHYMKMFHCVQLFQRVHMCCLGQCMSGNTTALGTGGLVSPGLKWSY